MSQVDLDDEEQLRAAQELEDQEAGNVEQGPPFEEDLQQDAGKQQQDEQREDPQPAAATEQTPRPEKQPDAAPVAGVASKDGKRVLPFAVVQAARNEKRLAREAQLAAEQRAAELEAKLAELSGTAAPKAAKDGDADPLDAIVERTSDDFPEVAEVAKQLKAMRQELAQRTAAPAPAAAAPAPPADKPITAEDVQNAIDAVPLLVTWQAMDAEKFERAKAIDTVLAGSPKWKDRPMAERFAEVTRRVADEFDIQLTEADVPPTPTPQPTPTRGKDPKAVIQSAKRADPNSLSDMKGGAIDTDTGRISDSMPVTRMRARFDQMSDAEIDAHLSRLG